MDGDNYLGRSTTTILAGALTPGWSGGVATVALLRDSNGIQIIEHIEAHGEALFRAITEHDQEGIVAKRRDAPYGARRHPTWIKIKNRDYSRRAAVEWRDR